MRSKTSRERQKVAFAAILGICPAHYNFLRAIRKHGSVKDVECLQHMRRSEKKIARNAEILFEEVDYPELVKKFGLLVGDQRRPMPGK
ncbi:hypothetical protein L596_017189 [Steinernema carpocapsae]|uniref:Uncharacterized protein n=1 Tax=Steinernema carpocapsae TaxID=34508 RepID=A0A4U5N1L5_STECR|nr:hypothetical protein L596_017189 [Steinernema carpocapsae]